MQKGGRERRAVWHGSATWVFPFVWNDLSGKLKIILQIVTHMSNIY